MPLSAEQPETILIVDDEETVRRTFREWLEGADLGCQVLVAADAESALFQANQQTVDLAVLDWNLGAGHDGLRLLEDLFLFNPGIVAIMVTGYAHQATPLAAMRMGVRDYFDKNQDLNRDTFLAAIRRQLGQIRPAKRERRLHESLLAFREAVAKVLPLVRSAAALKDPVPLPDAIRSLFRFLCRNTGARDGVFLVRRYDAASPQPEICQAYDAEGKLLAVELVPFARSVAGSAVSLQEPCAMTDLDQAAANTAVELQEFERGRRSLLAAPIAVAPGIQVVLELFDKEGDSSSLHPGASGRPAGPAFTEQDHRLVAAAADFGAEMLRQALAERQTHRVLFDAVAAALGASNQLKESLRGTAAQRLEQPPPTDVLERLRQGLGATPDADDAVRLAEAVRVLALRHGRHAVQHCIRLVEELRNLLDRLTTGHE